MPSLQDFIARTRCIYNIELHIARKRDKLNNHLKNWKKLISVFFRISDVTSNFQLKFKLKSEVIVIYILGIVVIASCVFIFVFVYLYYISVFFFCVCLFFLFASFFLISINSGKVFFKWKNSLFNSCHSVLDISWTKSETDEILLLSIIDNVISFSPSLFISAR